MILVHYPACGCRLEIPQADALEEGAHALAGHKCPRCHAQNLDAPRRPDPFAALMGQRRTPAKADAARVNGRLGGRPLAACTCGQNPHAAGCPVRRRERRTAKAG